MEVAGGIPAAEIDSPEMRSRCEEFNAYTLALVSDVSQIDHPAFLFFLCQGIRQDQHFAVGHLML